MIALTKSAARWLGSFPAGMFYCLVIAMVHKGLGSPPGRPALAANLASWFLSSCVALWVVADARKQRRELPYDFGTWVFFAWPFMAPIYLFYTRGWRGFATIGGFFLLYLAAVFSAGLFYVLRAMGE
jgi:hypothetical protein